MSFSLQTVTKILTFIQFFILFALYILFLNTEESIIKQNNCNQQLLNISYLMKKLNN